ncbi:MAG TPA: MarR family transcriptional regulator [Solirubrobacteraceae bacterium]|jgi:DNA-binding MarR family transcriptional regulator
MDAQDSRERLRLWLRLLAASNEIERVLRRRIRAEFGTTLPRFDVLAALDRAPNGLSMSELSRQLMVTNGNTTTIVAALAEEELVQRTVAPHDRRSISVELTESGRDRFERMADVHAHWVTELLAGIDEADVDQLSRGLHEVRLVIQANAETGAFAEGMR